MKTTNSGDAPKNNLSESVPNSEKRPDGQYVDHWILSDEERSKGFIRPVRLSYVHVGLKPKFPLRDLTDSEKEKYGDVGFVKFEMYPLDQPSTAVGRFWTEKELSTHGCGTETKMPRKIAETYAINPKFYGKTFCCGCNDYFPVKEFVWSGTEEIVGS